VGGPYRDTIAGMITELQSPHINLLIPVPNAKHGVGMNRDKFIPNPSLTSPKYLDYYRWLGKVIGIALRTNYTMELNLPSLFWKQLANIPVNISDLEAIDQMCVQVNLALVNIDKKGVTEAVFGDVIEEFFVTTNSAGKVVPLKEGGATLPVKFHNRFEYVRLVEEYHLHESSSQIEAIRQGMATIVPGRLVNLFTWQELEQRVCGIPDVDLVLLKKVTQYKNHKPESELVKNFWKVLESCTAEERQAFLRFTWGRSRMPLTIEEMNNQQNTRFILATAHKNTDLNLPESHTCFFQLDLPNYSTYEIMRERCLYAFMNCRSIDND